MSGSISVPFLELRAQHQALSEELVSAFRSALETAQFVGGPEVNAFEAEFASYCEAPWCVGVNSGTDALRLAYMALGVKPGQEIVTVAHTFIATSEAITQAGGNIKFVDIQDDTMTMDPAALSAAVSSRTVGVVPVHLYGHPAELEPIIALARRIGAWVVEDAAQAHGARYRGVRVGCMGALGAFSFYPGKNLGSLGEGGAIIGTEKDDVMALLKRLREHGQSSKYVHESEGYNGRLHAIQAAFLRVKLRRLDDWNSARRQVAKWYGQALAGISDLRLPAEHPDSEPVYHLYVVRTPARDGLREFLTRRNVGTGLHYPCPLHLQPAYAALGVKRGSLPVTEAAAAHCLSLPMFPEMTQAQVEQVADHVRAFFGH